MGEERREGGSGQPADDEARNAEIAALRRRVAELEQALAASSRPQGSELLQQQNLFRAILDNSSAVIFIRDRDKRYVLINRRYEDLFHVQREQVIGKTDFDLFPQEIAAHFSEHDSQVMQAGVASELEEAVPTDDGVRTYITLKFPIYNLDGSLYGVGGIATDITDRKRAEQEREAMQEQMLAAKETLLRELSTPLIPLAEGVVAMPIIGTIDSDRVQQLLQTLLEGIASQRARVTILDITGVKTMDAAVASALLQAARAARMLGSEVVLTGIGPQVAQSLASLGADLTGVLTLGTLQSGISYALQRRR